MATGRGDPLLQGTHLVGQGRLVTHRGGHPAEQGRDLGAGLGEPEDVVDEEQHVLVLDIAEVLRHGQARQGDPQPGARRLVHLAEDEGGVLEDPCLLHLEDEVVALTGPLAHTGEHRGATEVVGDPEDHLLDQHGLADAGATEQADLAALDVRGEQVEDLDAGVELLGLRLERVERRRIAVDRPALGHLERGRVDVQHVAGHVPDLALGHVADRHRDRGTGVDDLLAADDAVGRLEGDGADGVVTDVQLDLEGHRPLDAHHVDLEGQRVEDLGHAVRRELDVHDGADDTHDAAGGGGLHLGVLFSNRSHISHSLALTRSRTARRRHPRSR
ncbi:hypothetical protein SDC9_97277 [bioreactor metagenome]|uniref:Uncharacterized protein n=1 Tax=bioreactor metagenome TaxID=1076179 RepID=A0A645ABE7_9ZZZZ